MSQYEQGGEQRGSSALPWLLLVLVVLLAGVAGYFGYGEFKAEQGRTVQAKKETDEARAQTLEQVQTRKALEAKVAELEQKLQSAEGERTRLSTERDQLSQTVQEKEAELARLKATYTDLEEKMKKEISDGEIRLSQAEGRIQVDLVDKILFDSGDASLSPRGSEVLMRLGAVLAKVEDKSILVSGHTDDSPPTERLKATFPTNWELSVARAVNVVRFLHEKANVPQRRLVAAGHGETRPVATNANPKGRARNRRIEILLLPELPANAKKAELATGKD